MGLLGPPPLGLPGYLVGIPDAGGLPRSPNPRNPCCKPHALSETEGRGTCARAFEIKPKTTLNNGYLGSRNDEERSEMRYVV